MHFFWLCIVCCLCKPKPLFEQRQRLGGADDNEAVHSDGTFVGAIEDETNLEQVCTKQIMGFC